MNNRLDPILFVFNHIVVVIGRSFGITEGIIVRVASGGPSVRVFQFVQPVLGCFCSLNNIGQIWNQNDVHGNTNLLASWPIAEAFIENSVFRDKRLDSHDDQCLNEVSLV